MLEKFSSGPQIFQTDELPAEAEADVVVIGGGPGGLGAALAASWCGVSTLLVEKYGLPGGMAAVAEVHPFMISQYRGRNLDYPVYENWRKAMMAYLPAKAVDNIRNPDDYSMRSVHKSLAALAAEDLLLGSGVKVFYHHTVAGVEMDHQNQIRSLICLAGSRFVKIRGKCMVDCTGDANVAAMAGCPFDFGDEKGNCQPMTLCFKLSNVKIRYAEHVSGRFIDPAWRASINQAYAEAKKNGRIHCPREDVLIFPFQLQEEGVLHFNTTRVGGFDATDAAELSKAEIEGRRQLRELLNWLREDVPGFEDCRLLSMAVQIGVRESRRIRGDFQLTMQDFMNCARFPDAIARSSYHIDIHSPVGEGTRRVPVPDDGIYEIPYRCVLPQKCENLTVGGRPVSADVAVHSSLRIMPTAVSIGQGAGMGAALAVQQGLSPRQVNGELVHKKLIEFGGRFD